MTARESQFVDPPTKAPFQLDWVIGFNPTVPILNLTNSTRCTTVAVASAHVVNIYTTCNSAARCDPPAIGHKRSDLHDHQHHTTVQHLFGGHENAIHSLDSSSDGRFILSASSDACVVWDRRQQAPPGVSTPIALRQLNDAFGSGGSIEIAKISPDGRYALLVGHRLPQTEQTLQIQLWTWSSGQSTADAVADMPKNTPGPVLACAFNPYGLQSIEFAITTKQRVLFGTWCAGQSPGLTMQTPPLPNTNPGDFVMTTFCELSRCPFTISAHGTCTIWSRPFGDAQYAELKTVRIGRVPLKWMGYVDEMVVVLDAAGRLRFYDENLRIVFAGEDGHRVDVHQVSFDLVGRRYRLADPREFDSNSVRNRMGVENDDDDDRPELLYRSLLPKCTTAEALPFVVRNSVAIDWQGRVIRCDLDQRTADPVRPIESVHAHISAFDVNVSKNLLCAGCSDGQVFMYDYAERERVAGRQLLAIDGSSCAITCVMFAKSGTQLIVFNACGEVCIVDVIMLEPVGRAIHPSEGAVKLVCAAKVGGLFAYSDSNFNAVLVQIEVMPESTNMQLIGKNRAHSDVITYIGFCGQDDERLITFGDDRHLTKYDVQQSIAERKLVVTKRKRYEQSAQVLTAITDKGGVLMTSDNEFKIKTWNPNELSVSRTTIGPLLDEHPVRLLCHVPSNGEPHPDHDQPFMAFSTAGKQMGLQLLPFDGNAFRHVGMIAHPKSIRQMYALPDGQTLLTLGEQDHTIFVWSIRPSVVRDNYQRGGTGLNPFVLALPGGRNGALFREMLDFFYYMQIISKHPDMPLEQMTCDSDSIRLCDVADYLRGLGVFLGEGEEMNLVNELSDFRPQLAYNIQVSFGELLKVYVNHRPAKGYPIARIKQAIEHFCNPKPKRRDECTKRVSKANRSDHLDRDMLMHVCCTMGEKMGRLEAARYLTALLAHPDDDLSVAEILGEKHATGDDVEIMLENAPELFDIHDFLADILGLESTNANQINDMME